MSVDLRPAIPALVVSIAALAALLSQAFVGKGRHAPAALLALLGLGTSFVVVLLMYAGRHGRGATLGGSLVADDFALFLQALILAIAALSVLLASSYLRETGCERGEWYALLLFSVVGMMGLVSATDLISLFVALEIMSVALYALAGFDRQRPEGQESAVKYFVTGAFSSAFLLYGVALLYGLTGSTSLDRVASVLGTLAPDARPMALLGVGLLLVGFGFKVAGVPFHMWVPDVYEGAPTPVTAFMSAGVKAAAFGALLRVFVHGLGPLEAEWRPALAVLAVVTMVVGNLGALAQGNVKRMLAYSSVAHAGYLLAAGVATPRGGVAAILFYLVGYAAVNLGGFGMLAALARGQSEPLGLSDFAGLASRRPAVAAAATVFLVSLAGIPVSAGFVGKFYLFSAAVDAGYVSLAVVGVVMSVVSAFYYLRVVVAMYMREPSGEDPWGAVAPASGIALGAVVLVVLGLGVFPGPVLTLARLAARSL
ncbi:MAG TPA: NADH-quinone oxidoreductase subunit N [Vicinamibacteria bacterium]